MKMTIIWIDDPLSKWVLVTCLYIYKCRVLYTSSVDNLYGWKILSLFRSVARQTCHLSLWNSFSFGLVTHRSRWYTITGMMWLQQALLMPVSLLLCSVIRNWLPTKHNSISILIEYKCSLTTNFFVYLSFIVKSDWDMLILLFCL